MATAESIEQQRANFKLRYGAIPANGTLTLLNIAVQESDSGAAGTGHLLTAATSVQGVAEPLGMLGISDVLARQALQRTTSLRPQPREVIFTQRAQTAIAYGVDMSNGRHGHLVRPDDVLLGLIAESTSILNRNDNRAERMLALFDGVSLFDLKKQIANFRDTGPEFRNIRPPTPDEEAELLIAQLDPIRDFILDSTRPGSAQGLIRDLNHITRIYRQAIS